MSRRRLKKPPQCHRRGLLTFLSFVQYEKRGTNAFAAGKPRRAPAAGVSRPWLRTDDHERACRALRLQPACALPPLLQQGGGVPPLAGFLWPRIDRQGVDRRPRRDGSGRQRRRRDRRDHERALRRRPPPAEPFAACAGDQRPGVPPCARHHDRRRRRLSGQGRRPAGRARSPSPDQPEARRHARGSGPEPVRRSARHQPGAAADPHRRTARALSPDDRGHPVRRGLAGRNPRGKGGRATR